MILQKDESGDTMGKLTIYREESAAFTAVSNTFIDNYMADANDAQLKVYLYLLRAFQANQDTSISDMADLFNHTEKDIVRALKYWEKKSLLALDYDTSKNVSAIHLLTSTPISAGVLPEKAEVSAAPPEPSVPIQTPPSDPIPEKPSYSLDDLKAFRSNEETEQLLFIVEQYIGKPLSASEVRTVLFIYDKLGFSTDLIDYLVQYCVGKEKKSFRYIEKVAVEWAEHHISTLEQAKAFACKYDKNVYTIMKALGKSADPTPKEAAYITRWTGEWGFSLSVIEIACERTVLAVDRHRFEYADTILASWFKSHVHTVEDIQAIDAAYQKKKPTQNRNHSSSFNNQFNQFPQRDYDFDALEKELLSN